MRLSLPGAARRRLLALVPVILVLLVGALTYERSRLVVADVREVERSHETLEASGSLLTRAIDAEAKGLTLRPEGDDARLFTDGGKVRQILLNLLSNALKFTDSGEVVVRSRSDGESVMLAVMDTGIGIAAENLERIFDPFWQVEQRSTRKVGGTGLGLSVSRSLARLVGGDIRVESEMGKGSTFTLTFPVGQA